MTQYFKNTSKIFENKSVINLKKSYWLFRSMQYPLLIRLGIWVTPFLMYFYPFKKLIKNTLFNQFCGGETRDEALEVANKLYESSVYSILDFSVEGKNRESDFERSFQEVCDNITLAANNQSIPFVVFKPSAFGSSDLYEKVQNQQTLEQNEVIAWGKIVERFTRICDFAQSLNVTLMVDAEESWIQTAVDDLVEMCMEKYNVNQYVIMNTLQMYRNDRLAYLEKQVEDSKNKGYFLGFKVVRGAYMEKERERANEKNYASPIYETKELTDQAFNQAVSICLNTPNCLLFAGTHNEKSCSMIASHHRSKSIWLGQLYGMCDYISYNAADIGLQTAKYLPYGPIKEVIPYLVRRAQENSSVSSQSIYEMNLIKEELKRRAKK